MSGAKILLFCRLSLFTKYHKMFKIAVSFSGGVLRKQKGDCHSLCGKAIAFIISYNFYLTSKDSRLDKAG